MKSKTFLYKNKKISLRCGLKNYIYIYIYIYIILEKEGEKKERKK